MKKTAKSTQDFKAIKAALKLDGTIFTLKGKTTTHRNEAGEVENIPQRYKTSMHLMAVGEPIPVHSIGQDHWLSQSMNVNRFGSTKMTLYSFTPFGKRFSETIFYKNITIVSVQEQAVIPAKTKKRKGAAVINNMEIGGEAWLSQ